ncbi:MAG: (Fe-S)-binding protein, partial [Nocardioides sp.]
RAGNEFVFQGLAQQNIETFKEFKVKKVVSTCAHCFNTLKNEYRDFGIELEVVHHTQLLNRLVREGKLTPVNDGAGAAKRSITYHDPCYLGRHNQVYSPPRELLQVLPGASYVEMERSQERSFCCGAGGARMWMEETIGSRINENRTAEAVGTGADQIAVGCPFCRVMLSDGLTAKQSAGEAREEVEVLDVAQLLLASVKGESATKLQPGGAPAARSEETRAEPFDSAQEPPESGNDTETDEMVAETSEVGPAAKASSGSSSLFDVDDDRDDSATPAEAAEKSPDEATPAAAAPSGGSLFDLDSDNATDRAEAEPTTAEPEAEEPAAEEDAAPAEPDDSTEIGSGGSLFDLGSDNDEPSPPKAEDAGAEVEAGPEPKPEPEPEPEAEAEAAKEPEAKPTDEIPAGGSLFDLEAPAAPVAAAAPQPDDQPEQPAAEATDDEPEDASAEETPSSDRTSGADLSRLATAAASDEAVDDGAAEEPEEAVERDADDAEDAGDAEPESGAEKRDTPSDSTRTPPTDVDINESGSLFDL